MKFDDLKNEIDNGTREESNRISDEDYFSLLKRIHDHDEDGHKQEN